MMAARTTEARIRAIEEKIAKKQAEIESLEAQRQSSCIPST